MKKLKHITKKDIKSKMPLVIQKDLNKRRSIAKKDKSDLFVLLFNENQQGFHIEESDRIFKNPPHRDWVTIGILTEDHCDKICDFISDHYSNKRITKKNKFPKKLNEVQHITNNLIKILK